MPVALATVVRLRRMGIGAASLMFLAAMSLTGCPPVEPPPDERPEADFEAAPTRGTAPLTVTFTNLSRFDEFPIDAYNWSFGDGNTSTRPNPIHTYNQPGAYTVTLKVSNAKGTDTLVREGFVIIEQGSTFGELGPNGGTVRLSDIIVSVPAGAFQGNVALGLIDNAENFLINSPEPLQVLSRFFTLTHNSPTTAIGVASAAGVQPASITIPFSSLGVPPVDLRPETILVLAKLPDGSVVPVPGEVSGELITLRVTGMPQRADYVVVYRPEGEVTKFVSEGAEKLLPSDWANQWNILLSQTILQQLTALRAGTIEDAAQYDRRNFLAADLQTTMNFLMSDIERIHETLEGEGLRQPLLAQGGGGYNLVFYNMQSNYPTNFSDFRGLKWSDRTFGNLVIDPRQLIAVSQRNAALAESDPDAAQEFGFASAFAQEIFQAAWDGYGFLQLTAPSTSDRDANNQPVQVSFLEGLRESIAVFLGQLFDNQRYARAFAPGDKIDLAVDLFAPFASGRPGYAPAGHSFLLYVQRVVIGGNDLGWLFEDEGETAGVLEEVRREFASLPPVGPVLTFPQARVRTARAADRALTALEGVSLSDAYAAFITDVAVDRPEDAILYPGQEELPSFMLDPALFRGPAILAGEFEAATDDIAFTGSGLFANIPPFTSRVLRLGVFPLTDTVSLTVNSDDWTEDASGRSLEVTVYQPGEAGIVLTPGMNTVVLDAFIEDEMGCLDEILVVVSNNSLSQTNTFSIEANAFAGLTVAENDVLTTFVNACDPNEDWRVVSSTLLPQFGVRSTVLEVVSGAWRGSSDVNQVVWRHSLTIIEPLVATTNTGMLVISGGSTGSTFGTPPAQFVAFALATGSVVSVLQSVPNQPLQFTGESFTRSEDAIIAYSYDQYMDGFVANAPDMTWPALLPMTRAAVRAMDAVQEFLAASPATNAEVTNFVVTGASKRGWTTWLTAAADERVSGVMPLVIDVLNMDEQIAHHERAYCGFSDALQDYVDAGVFERLNTPQGDSLLQIVDPLSYVDRLDIPKFIINSTGDEFFLPDSSQFYYTELLGEKRLYYAPNTSHSLGGTSSLNLDEDVLDAMLAWYIAFTRGQTRPNVFWEYPTPDSILVTTSRAPLQVRLWTATNATSRDFRLETIGASWQSTVLQPAEDGSYTASVTLPESGWIAYYVEAVFAGPDVSADADYRFSTPVRVLPDTYPDCTAEGEGETEEE